MAEIRVQAQGAHGSVVRGGLFALRVRQAAGEVLRVCAPLRPPVIGVDRHRALLRNLRHVAPGLAETGQAGTAVTLVTVGKGEAAAIQVTGGQVDISPIAVGSGQTREQQVLLLMGFVIAAEIHLQLNAPEIAPGDEVHHPGDGVGTVQGRGTVLDHFYALQRDIGQQSMDIHVTAAAAVEAVADTAPAVDQHQRSAVAQVAQVDAGVARRGVAAHPTVGGDAQGTGIKGHVADDVLYIGGPEDVQVILVKGRQRRRKIRLIALDVGAGHHDFLDVFACDGRAAFCSNGVAGGNGGGKKHT